MSDRMRTSSRAIVALAALSALAGTARADDASPRDPDARITAQVAACEADQPLICADVAGAMQRAGVASRLGHTPAELRAHGVTVFAARCKDGDGDACWQHARTAHGADASAETAHACEVGSGDACFEVARHARGRAQRLAMFDRACTLGRGDACENAAALVGARDPQRVLALHRLACAAGHATGCLRAGERDRDAGEHDAAFAELSRACDDAVGEHPAPDELSACADAGAIAADPARARELYQRACDAGHGGACEALGTLIARGEGGPRDWGAGVAMVAAGCKLAHDRACRARATLVEHAPDWACATEEECTTHCDEQLWPACRHEVEIEAEHGPMDQDLLEKACTGGDALGCRMRGDGEAVFADALAWYRRGCAVHDTASCGYVQLDRALKSSSAAAPLRAACAKDPAACPLYGLAIAKRDRKRAADVWGAACDAKIGVACRYLARTFESNTASRLGDDAMIALVLGGTRLGYGVCDCDGADLTQVQADDENRRHDEAQRLLQRGCAAGDARSCEDVLGPDHVDAPPVPAVPLPAWE